MKIETNEHRQRSRVYSGSSLLKFLGCFLLLFLISTNMIAFGQTGRSITYSDITIDHKKEEIRIAVPADTTIVYCDAKKLDWMEAITMPEAGGHVAIIDISWISRSKEFILGIKDQKETSNSKMIKISLAPREEGLRAGLSGEAVIIDKVVNKPLRITYPADYVINTVCNEYGYIYFYTGSGYTARYYEEYDTIEWKNGTEGTWREFSEFNPALYANKGAAIYFRVKASTEETLQASMNNQGVYVTKGAPAGKEIRLSYTKLTNAPKVQLDTSELTVGLRAGYEYRILPDGEWVDAVDAHINAQGKMMPVSLYSLYQKFDAEDSTKSVRYPFSYQQFSMEIRIAATSKKPASKIYTLKVNAPKTTQTTGISVSYTLPYSKKDGISFSNSNADAYQVAIVSGKYCGGVATFDASKIDYTDIRWYNAKAGTTQKPSIVKIPGSVYTGKNVIDQPILVYRIAPVKESKTQEAVIGSKAVALNLPTEAVQSATDTVNSKVELVEGTAAEGKIEVTTANVSVGATPRITATNKPTGLSISADKVKADGKFTITVKISSATPKVDAYKFTVTIEGLKKEYTVVIKEKPAPTPTPSPTPTATPTPAP